MMCVTITMRMDRHVGRMPDIEQFFAQRDRGQSVERGKRLVHQQHLGLDRERAREADALLHPARQLARIGFFEAVEADLIDIDAGAFFALGSGDSPRASRPISTLALTVSHGSSAND